MIWQKANFFDVSGFKGLIYCISCILTSIQCINKLHFRFFSLTAKSHSFDKTGVSIKDERNI